MEQTGGMAGGGVFDELLAGEQGPLCGDEEPERHLAPVAGPAGPARAGGHPQQGSDHQRERHRDGYRQVPVIDGV